MAALLRQGARRIGGSVLQRTQAAVASPAAAEERRRLVPRRMYSSEERIAEGKKNLKDLSDQVGPRSDGFDWPSVSKRVGSFCNNVVIASVFLAILSESRIGRRIGRLFGEDRPKLKERA